MLVWLWRGTQEACKTGTGKQEGRERALLKLLLLLLMLLHVTSRRCRARHRKSTYRSPWSPTWWAIGESSRASSLVFFQACSCRSKASGLGRCRKKTSKSCGVRKVTRNGGLEGFIRSTSVIDGGRMWALWGGHFCMPVQSYALLQAGTAPTGGALYGQTWATASGPRASSAGQRASRLGGRGAGVGCWDLC